MKKSFGIIFIFLALGTNLITAQNSHDMDYREGLADLRDRIGFAASQAKNSRMLSGGIITSLGVATLGTGGFLFTTAPTSQEPVFGQTVGSFLMLYGSAMSIGGIAQLMIPTQLESINMVSLEYENSLEDIEQLYRKLHRKLETAKDFNYYLRISSGLISLGLGGYIAYNALTQQEYDYLDGYTDQNVYYGVALSLVGIMNLLFPTPEETIWTKHNNAFP